MSYFDNPKIDKASERCEESVNKTKSIFTRKNGFISREENPDNGVDFDIELIENSEATRNKFAIQIKSSQEFEHRQFDNQNFLILDFLTSRLGYLARNTPGLGLIVIYNACNDVLYYDYIENIIERINLSKKDCQWLYQEKVRIYIPEQNKLNQESIGLIYQKFLQVHKNHRSLLQNHATDFDIPYVDVENSKTILNEEKLLEVIEKFGIFLFNSLKINELINLISQLSYQKISQDPKLSFLAAIAYAEIGKPIDSNMFIQYFELKNEGMAAFFSEIIRFTKFKNDFTLGKRDADKYIDELEDLIKNSTVEQNILTLKINIGLLKIMNSIAEKEIDKSLLNEFKDLHNEIENSNIDENIKHLLQIFQAENYHACAIKIFSESILKQQLKERLGVNISQKERIANAKELNEMMTLPVIYAQKALTFANEKNDKLVKAHALHKIANFFFGTQLTSVLHNLILSESPSVELLKNCFSYSVESYNLFIELNLLNESHIVLVLAYEIKNLGLRQFNVNVGGTDLQTILKQIRNLENDIGKKRFVSVVDTYFQDKEKEKRTKVKDFTDEELEFFAKSVLEAKGLPQNRFANLLQDLKNRQLFERFCDTEKYEMIQNNVVGEDIYLYPTNYRIYNKNHNLLIGEGTDVYSLLKKLGFLKE